MSQALNVISTTLQGYGPSDTSLLPCFGVARRAVSRCPYVGSEFTSSQIKIISLTRSLKHRSFVCKASSSGQRRNPDFPRENRRIFSRNRNRPNEERGNSENLDESEFISTKNGPILSVSNNLPKSNATASPGHREREIVELFRKVQAQLRERAAVKEGKKFETVKEQDKESESVDSLLKLLRKHSVEQGKRKVNGGNASEANFDRPRQSVKPDVNTKSFPSSPIVVKHEPEETQTPSVGRPISSFRRRSPVPRVKYEPIISPKDTYDSLAKSDLDVNVNGAHYEPVPDFESDSESDLEPDLDIVSGIELDQEDELEELEEPEIELEPKIEFVGKAPVGDLSEVEVSDIEEDVFEEKDIEKQKQHSEVKDLNTMKLVELRAFAKDRRMKGFSKLKKGELVGLLSDDSSLP